MQLAIMQYREFRDSLDLDACPGGMEPCLQALWHAAKREWAAAHEIVQRLDTVMAARIHAYLHRMEGDDWNSRYWHRQAGSAFPAGMSLEAEWELLVRQLTE
jgi:predicted transcriptional regulator of viral defense system